MERTGFTLDRSTLQAVADGKSFRRGEEYCRYGQVGPNTERDGVIEARVRGTEAEWAKVSSLGPGQDNAQDFADHFRITSIMKTIAR
jgi:uncharacterized Zn finger protein